MSCSVQVHPSLGASRAYAVSLRFEGRPAPRMSASDSTAHDGEARALLARIAKRDQTAMHAFYRLFAPQVTAFALRQLREPGEAQEVTVDVMYEVWTTATRFRGESLVRTWLFSITRHRVLDRLRRRRDNTTPLDAVEDTLEAEEETAFDRLARQENGAHVAHCLEKLSDEHRECIHLVFYQDLPLAEVAQIQNCPENTVKTRLFHARRNLKRCLEHRIGDAS